MGTSLPKKVMVIFGTRPEATKMCPVVSALSKFPEWFKPIVVVTGQHKEQLNQVLDAFNLTPNVNLEVMKDRQSLSYVTGSILTGLESIINEYKPDIILVHGDTQTAMSSALAAFFHKIPVAHVEAGLRSFEKYSPFPEEINRKIADIVADILFSPTNYARENLLREGYDNKDIHVTGQTAVDAALATYCSNYSFIEPVLSSLDFKKNKIVTVTAHRRENYGEPMKQMFTAMKRLVRDNPETILVYPVHRSPDVREMVSKILSNQDRIILLDPLDYRDMINLMARSFLILSDSGGLQEESSVFATPLILMRDTTERQEAIDANCVLLGGTTEETIYTLANNLLNNENDYMKMKAAKSPFGDGKASIRIVHYLASYFGFDSEQMEEFSYNDKLESKSKL